MGDSFPNQSIDFFGALRARIYDDLVRGFIADTGLEALSSRLVNSREGPPKFETPQMDVDTLMKYGNLLVEEQENVKRVQLADAYLDGAELAGVGGSSLPEEVQAYAGVMTMMVPWAGKTHDTHTCCCCYCCCGLEGIYLHQQNYSRQQKIDIETYSS